MGAGREGLIANYQNCGRTNGYLSAMLHSMENESPRPVAMEHSEKSCPTFSPAQGAYGWRLPLLLLLVLGGIVFYGFSANRGDHGPPPEPSEDARSPAAARITPGPPSDRVSGEVVSLVVDCGNGAQRQFDALPWHEGMTVANLMGKARDFRPGITFTQRGAGKMAFLTSLDGIAGQAAGQGAGTARGWQYKINGEHGQQSFGSQILTPGDRVLWIYGPNPTAPTPTE